MCIQGWIEKQALVNAANHWVLVAFSHIQEELLFPMKGAHYDNDTEFINDLLPRWCLERHIEPMRTKPYHKNDNCYAEPRNFDAVWKTVGCFRFDTPSECTTQAEVY
jgi:hypothetical protein